MTKSQFEAASAVQERIRMLRDMLISTDQGDITFRLSGLVSVQLGGKSPTDFDKQVLKGIRSAITEILKDAQTEFENL